MKRDLDTWNENLSLCREKRNTNRRTLRWLNEAPADKNVMTETQQNRPTKENYNRDLQDWKETYKKKICHRETQQNRCTLRWLNVAPADKDIRNETHQNRPTKQTYNRDLQNWKETYKKPARETYRHGKRPAISRQFVGLFVQMQETYKQTKQRVHKTEKRPINEKRTTNEQGPPKKKKDTKKTDRRRRKETSSHTKRDMHAFSPFWDVCCGIHCNTYLKIDLLKRRRKETCAIENKRTKETYNNKKRHIKLKRDSQKRPAKPYTYPQKRPTQSKRDHLKERGTHMHTHSHIHMRTHTHTHYLSHTHARTYAHAHTHYLTRCQPRVNGSARAHINTDT